MVRNSIYVDEKKKTFDSDTLVGCHNMAKLATDHTFNFALFLGAIVAYSCVVVDFVSILAKTNHYQIMQPMTTGSFIDIIFCYDFLFLINIVLKLNLRAHGTKNWRIVLFAIDVFSFVPFELIYITVAGTDTRIFYGFRLRYTLRLLGPMFFQNRRQNYKFNLLPMILKYIVVTYLICLTLATVRLLTKCLVYIDESFDCNNLKGTDFVYMFCMSNGLATLCDLLFVNVLTERNAQRESLQQDSNQVWMGLAYIYVSIVQFILYMMILQMFSKIICMYIERLSKKYEFAILSNLVLKDLKKVKKELVGKWSVKDYIFEEFLRKFLKTSWYHWESTSKRQDFRGYAVATMPDIIRTEILLDVSWNMFKHSMLFRNEDVHFLRHLSLRTTFKALMQGQPVFKKDVVKVEMLYIISGVVHVLSEENMESPIISFTAGTVLGEMALFMAIPSTATVICKTYCEFISLTHVNFLKCRTFYPYVYEKMKNMAAMRLGKARNYHNIGKEYYRRGLVSMEKRAVSLRYIKKTLHKYLCGESKQQNICDMLTLGNLKEDYDMSNSILCAEYLTMYVIADERDIGTTEHFLTTGFFFKLNPNSTLVDIWNFIVYVLIIMTFIVYPVGAVTSSNEVYDAYMLLVAVVWFIDFFSFGFIGIQTKSRMHSEFEYIFNKHIQTVDFWLDFFSSFPFEYVFSLLEGPLEEKVYRLLQMNRLLKAHKLLGYFSQKQYMSSRVLLFLTMMKILVTAFSMVLFGSYIFYVNKYYDLADKEGFAQAGILMHMCLLCQFFVGTLLCEFKVPDTHNLSSLIAMQYIGFLWKLIAIPQLAVAFSLHYTMTIELENLIDDIRKVFVLDNFDGGTKKKIMKYLYMHYQCGKGLHMLKVGSLVEFVGNTLYKTQRGMMFKDLLEKEGLFKNLRSIIIRDFCEIPKLILIPKGEFVVFAGSLPKEIYIIVEGTCAYVTQIGARVKILKKIYAGSSLLVIEVLSRVKIVHNVITLTDCKLLSLPYNELIRKFIKYPNEYYTLHDILNETVGFNAISEVQSKEMVPTREMLMENQRSVRRFRRNTAEYILPFGNNKKIFRILLMPITFRPHGAVWIHWEIFHIVVTYMSALTGTIPITIVKGWTSPVFWTFRLFDLVALTDMYLRHHVFFYNKLNIEVSHPWSTAVHYWKTSFVLDLLSLFPFEVITVQVIGENRVIYVLLSRLNRYIRLYRIFGIKKFLNETFLSEVRSVMLAYYVCSTLLFFQFAAYCGILSMCRCHAATDEIECEPGVRTNFWSWHFFFLRRLFRNVFNVGLFEGSIEGEKFWKYTIVNVVGYLMMNLISSMITAIGLSRNSYLTTFQIKMQRLIVFMNMRKIDKNLRNELIKYYEYLWLLREGKTLQFTFDMFNLACYEEVMFSQLGRILQASIIFKSFPKVIIKDFLSSDDLHRDMFLIKGIIIHVNDVQDKIYILCKGTVEVLGPECTKLQTLEVGSVFGCLENVRHHRSTLTYVAKTHCELLSMESMKYYSIVRKYPRFHKHFLFLVQSSNIDYIVSHCNPKEEAKKLANQTERSHVLKVKKEMNRGTLHRCFNTLSRVHRPNEKFNISMVVFCFISFMVEAYQKVVMATSLIMICVCYIFDVLFLVRMHVKFSTSFENAYGLWVEKRKLIALRYVKNRFGFFFDLACSFPFEVFSLVSYGHDDWAVYWSLLRVNRLLKIIIVFKFVKSFQNRLNVNVYFIRSSYILLLVITLQQLSMILIANAEWSDRGATSWGTYLSALGVQTYFLSTALGYASQTNDGQYGEFLDVIYVILMFVTRFVMIYVFAEYVACYQVLNYGKYRYRAYLKGLDCEMHNKRVSLPLLVRVMRYFDHLADTGRNVQFPVFVREAPYYLREGLLDSMFGFHLRRHPIFKECHSDLVRQIAATFETIYFFPGDFITFYGDIDCKMYFIHEGVVHGLIEDNLYYDTVETKFKTGDSFGFKQLFYKNVGHRYSYKVVSECTILVLRRDDIIHLLDFFPASKFIIYNFPQFAKPKVNINDALK